MLHYLLIFTIGPVQSLINHSRKVSDIYGGSKLLSGLMRKAVDFLDHKPDIEILFPMEEKRVTQSDMPNRLIAEISTDDLTLPGAIGRELEIEVKTSFLDKCHKLLQNAGMNQKGWTLAERQLRSYLEIYWLAEPYNGRSYKQVYGSLFRRIQEIKSIRPFAQAMEPWNRKCMLFPEYNAVFVKRKEKHLPANINSADIYDITELNALRYAVKPGEALSAIALVKRVYPNPEEIYSLRQMLLRSRVNSEKLCYAGSGEGDMFANAVYDFDNRNPPDYEEYKPEMWETAKVLCSSLHHAGTKLSSYYAMVKLDGDSMGDEFLNKTTPEEQKALSSSIGKFASKIPGILHKYKGLSVYSGGEDFLGFLPLDTLFSCLEELHAAFRQIVGLTFSAGIAVAHLMQPLKEVAVMAEEMERLAKQAKGKNACVLGFIKRSGEMVVTPSLCFDDAPDRLRLLELKLLVQELNNAGCSKSLLYYLGDLFRPFLEEGAGPDISMVRILVHEAAVSSAVRDADKMAQKLIAFYKEEDLAGFMNILNAAAFLAREVQTCTM